MLGKIEVRRMYVCHVQLFANLWTIACQAPLSMKFSRQAYWSGLSFPLLLHHALLFSTLCLRAYSVKSDSAAPWTVVCQAPLSMEFSQQEQCSGLPFPSPGDLSNPGIESGSTALVGLFFTTKPLGKPLLLKGRVKWNGRKVKTIEPCLDSHLGT